MTRGDWTCCALLFLLLASACADSTNCTSGGRPDCSQQSCDWADAQRKVPACMPGSPSPTLGGFSLRRCGEYDALVEQGTDSLLYYFYDNAGQPAGKADTGIGGVTCVAFDSSFDAPELESCTSVTPRCD